MIMGHSKHELSTKNMLYSIKKIVLQNPYLFKTPTSFTTFFRPQGGPAL